MGAIVVELQSTCGAASPRRHQRRITTCPLSSCQRCWTSRPLSSYELSDLLRDYLECPNDSSLSSHSLKSTVLSWAAKCEMPREYRRVLGRHSSSVKESDSVYARELSFAPVRAMERMFHLIRKSEFNPDAARAPEPGAAPAFPPTPAFLASGAAPCTPAEKLARQESIAVHVNHHGGAEVKEESLEVPQLTTEVGDDHKSVAIVSSSEDESESSGAESRLRALMTMLGVIRKLYLIEAQNFQGQLREVNHLPSMKCGCSMCI